MAATVGVVVVLYFQEALLSAAPEAKVATVAATADLAALVPTRLVVVEGLAAMVRMLRLSATQVTAA
jgi:hypothetical protein